MFWADRIVADIERRFGKSSGRPIIVRDEKTVSGRVHVGSMRGLAIHGIVSEALADAGVSNVFKYEFNDFDPMDDIPSYLPREKYEQYLGMPLNAVPSPDASANSFAEYFAKDFREVITGAGFSPEFYWSSELYLSGAMDGVIREALLGAEAIRRIYEEVSGGHREENWLPLAVICPTCGKMSTTEATDFDGETVAVRCLENKVDWARGCGFSGRVSPFGGKAKLPWKAEWPAKWKVVGVGVEGGGKDHSTKGGSRDVASHISREVFHDEPPFDIPYEFFLVGGKKMSSSKGLGSSARDIASLVPPKIFRLALLSKDINQAINFDPDGDTIPVLYDLYDKLAESYHAGVRDDYSRLFELAHPSKKIPVKTFLPRFSQVAFIVQMPHLDLEHECSLIKGDILTDEDRIEIRERAQYAKQWLELYAPEKFKFVLQKEMSEAAKELSDVQKNALKALADFIESKETMPDGEAMHHRIHEIKTEQNITPADLFSAVYLAFLGKAYGPKAGWFLSVLDRDFVLNRLREVIG